MARKTIGKIDMRYAKALGYTVAVLLTLGLPLYFYFTKTLIVLVYIISATFIGSIVWACGKYEFKEILDPIREKYKMNTISYNRVDEFENIEEAASAAKMDLPMAKNIMKKDNSTFQRLGFMESLPKWIITKAFPFIAISAPKWIIALIIGVLVIRFHEDIIPHKKEEKNQSMQSKITLQIEMSGNTQKGEDKIDSAIDVSDYCIKAHGNQDVIVLSNEGCN